MSGQNKGSLHYRGTSGGNPVINHQHNIQEEISVSGNCIKLNYAIFFPPPNAFYPISWLTMHVHHTGAKCMVALMG